MNPARVLVADPPWPFRDRLPGNGRGAAKHYRLLALSAIAGFPILPIDDDAYLFLWRVSSMVEEAYQVCRTWGFTPKTELVWVKQTALGKRWFGMGHHLRAEHETAIVAVRGNPKPLSRAIRSVLFAKAGRHSAKPDEFYELVERFSPGPYLELFARRHRSGWTCLGDELEQAA